MNCTGKVTDEIIWVGGNDRRLNLFENAYPIPRGVSYNAYVVLDEETVLVDTVDKAISDLFLENLEAALSGRTLKYIIVQHMEPDHAATLVRVCERYPEAKVIASAKAAVMMGQFFGDALKDRIQPVAEGDVLETGRHQFAFAMAPMVHWPEVMVTYEKTTKTLFSADAFGTFGALSGVLFADEVDFERDWLDDARRYYTNIVGKYGAPVQALLKKAAGLDIALLCPLHGPIWRNSIGWFVEKYQQWSTCTPEEDGVLIAYASVYGHTENAAEVLAMDLRAMGVKKIALYDVSVTHPSYIVSDAFRFSKLAFLSATYNSGIFPAMETLLLDLKAHALKQRTVALAENGSWAPTAAKQMREILSGMQNLHLLDGAVSIRSSLNAGTREQLREMARQLAEA
ncbi:MAG: FprA family A-type flavoprotein [Clostridia bacterium]|nr:FprA family A-type flavoprotein [Clostridia bacterium]